MLGVMLFLKLTGVLLKSNVVLNYTHVALKSDLDGSQVAEG